MLTGAEIAETLANDPRALNGMSEPQLETLREYVAERLPEIIENYLELPASHAICCQVTAACLRDMVKQGTIIKLMLDAPCHCCGMTPEFCEVTNREFERLATELEAQAMGNDPATEARKLAEFGLRPDLVDQAMVGDLSVERILASQPFLFLHPHNR